MHVRSASYMESQLYSITKNKKHLNITEATNLLHGILSQLEQKISDMMEEEIYDELMDKNGGHDWIDKQVTKHLEDENN